MMQSISVLLVAALVCFAVSFFMIRDLNQKIANGQKATSDLKYVVHRLLLQHKEDKDEND